MSSEKSIEDGEDPAETSRADARLLVGSDGASSTSSTSSTSNGIQIAKVVSDQYEVGIAV